MYSIIEKKKVALGLLEQVLHKKKKKKKSHGAFSSAFGNSWKLARSNVLLKSLGHPVVGWD